MSGAKLFGFLGGILVILYKAYDVLNLAINYGNFLEAGKYTASQLNSDIASSLVIICLVAFLCRLVKQG